MYCQHRLLYSLILLLVFTLLGCGKKPITYEGISYPLTTNVRFTFQEHAIPAGCRVFSHAIVSTPENATNLQIKEKIVEDAKIKGADLIYLGLARTISSGDAPDIFQFHAYGPRNAYPFHRQWVEWEFGFEKWGKGEDLVNLGYDNYADPDFLNETGVMVKHALLQCQPSP